jgi:Transposase DDE domain
LAEALPPADLRAFLPRRWVVERTFSWLGQNRRMSKYYERLSATSEAFVYVAMTHLMVSRLARPRGFADSFWETVRKVIGVTL